VTGLVGALGAGLVVVYGLLNTGTATTRSLPTSSPVVNPPTASSVALDDRRQQLTGVRVARVTTGTLAATIRAPGRVAYDDTRIVDVNLKLDGWIRDLPVNAIGRSVTRGQALLTLYSPDLITAQTQYVSALKNRDQTPRAPGDELGTRLVEAPRLRLQRWDVPEDQIRRIEEEREVLPAVVFRSPADGVVIEKNVMSGMHVEIGRTLFKIADVSKVWLEAEFRESDLADVRQGAQAEITFDAYPREAFAGTIDQVFPFLTPDTRSVKARIVLANRTGRLKPGMLANVVLRGVERSGLLIPVDAIVDSGNRRTVFVSQGSGHFEPREITVGERAGGQALVLSGLREREEIATRGAFFLDSESRMQAALEDYRVNSSPAARTDAASGITLTMQFAPDPPRKGENIVEVHASDQAGRPIVDADVRVVIIMPAMPSMNMPAMRSDASTEPTERGIYRGRIDFSMAGRWDVSATAYRNGEPIAATRSSVVAR